MSKLTDIIDPSGAAKQMRDVVLSPGDLAEAVAAINQYIAEIIGLGNEVATTKDYHWIAQIRNELRREQRTRAGLDTKGDV